MSYHRTLAATSLFLLAVAPAALCQTGRGTLTGSVLDARGGVLQGAKVTLDPSGAVATSDSTGQFAFPGIAAGDYTVTVTYAGFADSAQKVTVAPGQSARLATTLTIASNLQDVQVYAEREGGELEAINRTFNADNIINVLPADVITSLPNANIADALGRLPSVTLERDEGEGKYVQIRGTEPRLSNTTVDGVNIASAETVRQVKLDIVPADLVESVQINKTLQANMEGDGIGGSVDLRTKSAGERPTIALEATGGRTPIEGGRNAYQFDGTLGKRFLEGNKLGVIGTGSYDWNGRGIEDVEPNPVLLGGYDERLYQYYRRRVGFAGTIDYRFSDTSSIYLKGLYSIFHNYGNRWDYGVATTYTPAGLPDGTGNTSFGAEIRRPVQDLGSIQLGGRHVITRSLFAWDLESSVGRTRDKGYSDASFVPIGSSPLNAIQFTLDNSNPLVPKLVAPAGANIFDPAQYQLDGQRINRYYNPEVDLGLGASLATSYTLAGHTGNFEFGGRFRNVHKFANNDTVYFVPTDNSEAATLMTNFLGTTTDANYYSNGYQFGPTVEYTKVSTLPQVTDTRTKTLDDGTVVLKNPSVLGQNFNFLEKVSAGYVMNTIDVAKFRIVAGLRIENTSENDEGSVGTTSTTTVPTANGSYISFLPSGSVRYALTPASGIRAVYGRGISRPNFSDLTSFATISPGGVRTTSSIGNPDLKAEHADNFDLLYERNMDHSGLLQAGFYYKRLTDPILSVTSLVNGLVQTQPLNAGTAYVYGFEIAFQQHFTYLPSLLSGLGLSANYGYSASQVTFPPKTNVTVANADGTTSTSPSFDRTDHPDLLRQAPHTWNVSPTYDKGRLSVRLGLSYNAANIFSYNYTDSNAAGPLVFNNSSNTNPDGTSNISTGNTATGGGFNGPNGDIYLYAHLQTDLQGSFKLGKGFTAVAYGLNLNNEVFGFYVGNPDNDYQREFYKPTFGGGLRWSPREK